MLEVHFILRKPWLTIKIFQIGTLGTLAVYIVVHPSYQSRQYRLFRLSTFILIGLSAIAPIIHAIEFISD